MSADVNSKARQGENPSGLADVRLGFADRAVHDLEQDGGPVPEGNADQSGESFGGSPRDLQATGNMVRVKRETSS